MFIHISRLVLLCLYKSHASIACLYKPHALYCCAYTPCDGAHNRRRRWQPGSTLASSLQPSFCVTVLLVCYVYTHLTPSAAVSYKISHPVLLCRLHSM